MSASAKSKTSRRENERAPRFSISAFLRELDLIQTIRLLTLALALVFGPPHWFFETTTRLCLLAFLLYPRVIRRPFFWLALSVAATVFIIADWQSADNHKYLLAYWLWILFFSSLFADAEKQRRLLVINARFFLCFIFLAAAAQKIASPTFRSGEMFEYLFYADPRFAAFTKIIGVDPSTTQEVQKRIMFFRSPFSQVENNELEIPASSRARGASHVLTWWDASVQAAIGAAFLFRRRATDIFAHSLLLLFVFTTYIPAPIFGFGWILSIMGFALAQSRFPRIATVYLISFAVILLYQLPWRDWVLAS